MGNAYLNRSELEIMELLWDINRPLSRSEIISLSHERSWKESYLHIILNKLLEKGVIRVDGFVKTGKNYGRTYFPNMTLEEYLVQLIQKNELYNKSKRSAMKSIFAALINEKDMNDDMIAGLREMLDEREEHLEK